MHNGNIKGSKNTPESSDKWQCKNTCISYPQMNCFSYHNFVIRKHNSNQSCILILAIIIHFILSICNSDTACSAQTQLLRHYKRIIFHQIKHLHLIIIIHKQTDQESREVKGRNSKFLFLKQRFPQHLQVFLQRVGRVFSALYTVSTISLYSNPNY